MHIPSECLTKMYSNYPLLARDYKKVYFDESLDVIQENAIVN